MEELVRLPDTPESEVRLGFGLSGLKTAFDLSWKVVLVLWAVSQFYFASSETSKKVTAHENNIQALETKFNKLDRDLVEIKSEVKYLHDQMVTDREFYMQTRK